MPAPPRLSPAAPLRLPDASPLPYALAVAASLAWCGYALVAVDAYLACNAYAALLPALFFALTTYGFASQVVSVHQPWPRGCHGPADCRVRELFRLAA